MKIEIYEWALGTSRPGVDSKHSKNGAVDIADWPDGQTLPAVGDTLYTFDARGVHTVWRILAVEHALSFPRPEGSSWTNTWLLVRQATIPELQAGW